MSNSGFNKVILMGNLTREPSTENVKSTTVTNLSVAVNEKYKNKDGELMESVTFVDVEVWGKRGESCQQYLEKGQSVLIEGKLKQSQWETEKGEKRSRYKVRALTVQFLQKPAGAGKKNESEDTGGDTSEDNGVDEDSVPF